MKLLDVNVVLAAHRADHPDHATARGYLQVMLASGEPFGVPWVVWWSFVRLASHTAIFPVPTPVPDALAFIEALRAQPGHLTAEAGGRHMRLLAEACRLGEATANLVPDAVLVALAIEHGATIVSYDRDFGRFDGVDWIRPG